MSKLELTCTGKTARPTRAKGGRFTPSKSTPVKLVVKSRPQTAHEGRLFSMALNSLVAELVRRELRRGEESK